MDVKQIIWGPHKIIWGLHLGSRPQLWEPLLYTTASDTSQMKLLPPCHHLDKLSSHDESSEDGLGHDHQLNQFLVPLLLQDAQETSFEEHLLDRFC